MVEGIIVCLFLFFVGIINQVGYRLMIAGLCIVSQPIRGENSTKDRMCYPPRLFNLSSSQLAFSRQSQIGILLLSRTGQAGRAYLA